MSYEIGSELIKIWYLNYMYMGPDTGKPVFGGLPITQELTSLRIRSVWSAPLLFAFWNKTYVNLLQVIYLFSS